MNCVATSVKDRLTNLVYSLAEAGFFTSLRESGDANAEYALNNFQQTNGYETLVEEGIQFDAGCSKIVIYDDYCDYVLKVATDIADDYCGTEARIYADAVKLGIDCCFAQCEKLMTYTEGRWEWDIYMMEFCECGYDMVAEKTDNFQYRSYLAKTGKPDTRETEEEFYDSYDTSDGQCTSGMIAYAVDCWRLPLPKLEALLKLLAEYRVNDLHCGNWGYIDGQLVLVDYSGYGEFEEREFKLSQKFGPTKSSKPLSSSGENC